MGRLVELWGVGRDLTAAHHRARSNTVTAATGSGLSNRTAWAGAGTAVLFFDPNSLNKIIDRNQYIFTQWDPTATSDMQALRDVFDSNGDGVFNASDAKWSQFKLLVTNADGTQTVETLAQAGITSINLKTDTTNIQYRDGSAITGETSFTFSNGTTGTVASVSFATDAPGYAVTSTTTVNADGSTTIDNKALNSIGSLANETISTTSAEGRITNDNFGRIAWAA